MTTEDVAAGRSAVEQAAGALVAPETPSAELLILSEDSESTLEESTLGLRDFLSTAQAVDLRDVAYSLQTGCENGAHRRMLVCAGREDAVAALAEKNPNRLLSSRLDAERRPAVLLLPGVGDQYVGMGYGLYATSEVFRQEVDRCARILEAHLGLDIRTVLYPESQSWKSTASSKGIDLKRMLGRSADDPPDPDTVRLNTTQFAQPALFTIEYALARLWMSFGITPDALVGHSMGEYVAACLAGVFTLDDALRLIAVRAKLVSSLPEAVMLAVMLPEEELRPILPPRLYISLINGPSHCVVAGSPAEVGAFEETLKQREVIARRVQNGHAFHTSLLQPVLEPFEAEVRKVNLNAPQIPYISNVSGDWVTAPQATDPSYWVKHASNTARFSDGLRRMWQLPNPALIECGPGKTLNVLAAQHPDRQGSLRGAIWSMRQRYENEQDTKVLLTAIGKVWLAGGLIRWEQIPRPYAPHRIPISIRAQDQVGAVQSPVVVSDSVRTLAPAETSENKGLPSEDDDRPATPRERELVEIWKTALGKARVGVNDSFGALGGDSLSSVGAILEMKRVGVSDEIARGLYRDLTIRQMAHLEAVGGSGVAQGRKVELSSIETPIFFRAFAIYLVVASHLGVTTLGGNWTLMIVSGLNFAKFQLRTVEKEKTVAPILRLMLKLAIPCLLFTLFAQIWDHTLHGARFSIGSWFFLDNFVDPRPFKGGESPWFVDLLLQCWLVMAGLLATRAVRQFALRRTYAFGLLLLGASWLISVIVPLLIDPDRTWKLVPYMYLWLMAFGWCAAYSRNDRERVVTSIALVILNAIDVYFHVGLVIHWWTVVGGLAIIWLDEIPIELPRLVMEALIGAAGASLFIYLTHLSFVHVLRIVWKDCPPIVLVGWAMLGGFFVWKGWNETSRLALLVLRRVGFRNTDLRLGAADG